MQQLLLHLAVVSIKLLFCEHHFFHLVITIQNSVVAPQIINQPALVGKTFLVMIDD